MSQRPSGFDLYLPGVVAGMILAAFAPTIRDTVLHDAFEKVFQRQTFLLLAVAIGTASPIGFVNLLFPPRENEESSQHDIRSSQSKNKHGLSSGGTDVL